MSISSIRTGAAALRADNLLNRHQELKRLPRMAGEPFSCIAWNCGRLAWFRSRLLGCRTPRWPLRSPLLLRNILGLHFGLIPVEKKRWIGVVRNQRAGEMDCAVLFDARRLRLADHLHVHVGRRGLLKFVVARHKRD